MSGRRSLLQARLRGGGARLLVGALALAVVAACGGGGAKGGSDAGTPPSEGTPKVGGTLSFAEFSAPAGLDPIIMTGAGSTGLIETTAVFDTLMRFDADTGKYIPGTADSATPNADSTVWTIKLHPGVKFTDGTSYDAEAVVFGLNRFRSGGAGAPPCEQIVACPRNATSSSFPASFIKDVTAVDDLTVKVTLNRPWAAFPVALSSEIGLIPSPTALKKCDPSAPVAQCGFNTAPVGAGPFMVTSFKPGEGITMVRNPNYWGGQVYLDGLRFANLGDGGGLKTLDALKAGQFQGAYLRDPAAVVAAHSAGLSGFANPAYGGSVLLMNVGSPNAATHSLTVRQAVAAAVDPNVVNQRAYGGDARATSQLFPPTYRWYPDVPGPTYDTGKAKQLVSEAKSAGWNGKIRVLASNVPSVSNAGLALQAMLTTAGMDVALDNTKDTAAATGQLVKKDFDIFISGLPVSDDDTSAVGLAQNFDSTSPSNRVGISDPVLDAGLQAAFAAATDAQKKDAYRKIAVELNAQMPMLSMGVVEVYIPFASDVHGVQPDVRTSVHLDKAWIG